MEGAACKGGTTVVSVSDTWRELTTVVSVSYTWRELTTVIEGSSTRQFHKI